MPDLPRTSARGTESVGEIEIRLIDGEPDDIVMPWPVGERLALTHIERMDARCIWAGLTDQHGNEVHFRFRSKAPVHVSYYVNRREDEDDA